MPYSPIGNMNVICYTFGKISWTVINMIYFFSTISLQVVELYNMLSVIEFAW